LTGGNSIACVPTGKGHFSFEERLYFGDLWVSPVGPGDFHGTGKLDLALALASGYDVNLLTNISK